MGLPLVEELRLRLCVQIQRPAVEVKIHCCLACHRPLRKMATIEAPPVRPALFNVDPKQRFAGQSSAIRRPRVRNIHRAAVASRR